MAVAIPSDLIRKIQIKLREGAGLPSYDPADPALRFFPPAEEAQWVIDPAAVPCPDSISFNTTEGCRRLLKSLDLHDSEFVSTNTQSKDSRKHQKVDDGMLLSDYLSIEIRHHIEGERDQKISSVNEPAQSSYALNLSGVDLDDYFSDAKKETKISFPKKSTALENIDFFEKAESPEKVNSIATWDVDFPSTEPHPRDPFQEQSGGHLNDSSKLHYTSDTWQLDDLWPTSSSNVLVNPSISRADDDVYEDWQDFTGSRNADYTSNILPDAGSEVILSKQSVDFEGDDFGSFLQFGEDSSQQSVMQPQVNDSSKLHYTSDTWQLDDLWPTSSSNVSVNPSIFRADDEVYEDWQDFTGSRNADFTSNILPDAGSEVVLSKQSVDFEDDDFGSFLQFGEDSSQQSVMQPQDLFSGGMNGWDETKVVPPEDPTTVADKFLSQMHDLSFMPENSLSIPGRSQPSDRAL